MEDKSKAKIIFQIISLLFLMESILLIIGIHKEVVVYASGVDLATALMRVIISAVSVIVFVMNLILLLFNIKMPSWLSISLTLIIMLVGWYFLFRNQFEIRW